MKPCACPGCRLSRDTHDGDMDGDGLVHCAPVAVRAGPAVTLTRLSCAAAGPGRQNTVNRTLCRVALSRLTMWGPCPERRSACAARKRTLSNKNILDKSSVYMFTNHRDRQTGQEQPQRQASSDCWAVERIALEQHGKPVAESHSAPFPRSQFRPTRGREDGCRRPLHSLTSGWSSNVSWGSAADGTERRTRMCSASKCSAVSLTRRDIPSGGSSSIGAVHCKRAESRLPVSGMGCGTSRNHISGSRMMGSKSLCTSFGCGGRQWATHTRR